MTLQESCSCTLFCVPYWDEPFSRWKRWNIKCTTYSQYRTTNETFLINERNMFQGYRSGYALFGVFGVPVLVSTVQQRHGHNEITQQRSMNMIQRLGHPSRRGLKGWYSSVWRRKGAGISSMLANTWREAVLRTQTGFFQCVHCQEMMQGAWNETLKRFSKNQEKWFYTSSACPEQLWSLLPWRYSKAI